MKQLSLVIMAGALTLTPATVGDGDVAYVRTRDLIISFEPADGAEVAEVELWLSTGAGATWRSFTPLQSRAGTLRHTVPDDGRYDLYLVLRNRAGISGDPPQPSTKPHATFVVDTVRPVLQLHRVAPAVAPDGPHSLSFTMTLVEENLGPGAVRVFYRTDAKTPWFDGGTVTVSHGQAFWPLPAEAAPLIDVLVSATDLAGNEGVDQLLRVPSDAAQLTKLAPLPSTRPSKAPFNKETSEPAVVRPSHADVVHSTSRPVSVSPTDDSNRPHAKDAAPDSNRLRSLGRQYLAAGQYELAAARLADALAASPTDADLLVELGSALYRAGRQDEAAARFAAALAAAPAHVGAIDGLALVAATQKRYADARAHLLRELELVPESGQTWLRYGDLEHKLGHLDEALGAWRRVLEVDEADGGLRAHAKRRLDYFTAPVRPRD